MKEIKFRGQRVDTKEWVYGSLISRTITTEFNDKVYYAIVIFDLGLDSNYNAYLELEVIPETVGKFTGLKDKKGKEIYKNDIVRDDEATYQIIFCDQNMRWDLLRLDDDEQIGAFGSTPDDFFSDIKESRVIGNIHESPNLLK